MKAAAALVALVLLGCGPMLYGAHGPSRPAHFLLVVHNVDVAADETATVTWWEGSSVVGSSALLVPSLGARVFDLGTAPPDGLQVVATAWNGIPGGPGGAVWQTPEYEGTWVFHVVYPTLATWKGGPP